MVLLSKRLQRLPGGLIWHQQAWCWKTDEKKKKCERENLKENISQQAKSPWRHKHGGELHSYAALIFYRYYTLCGRLVDTELTAAPNKRLQKHSRTADHVRTTSERPRPPRETPPLTILVRFGGFLAPLPPFSWHQFGFFRYFLFYLDSEDWLAISGIACKHIFWNDHLNIWFQCWHFW